MILIDGTFEEDDKIWFVGNKDNILYCMDKDFHTEMVAVVPAYEEDYYRANPICIKDENKVFMLPDKAKEIYVYNLENGDLTEISINLPCQRCSISNGWVIEGTLWCISNRIGELLKCNIRNNNVEKIFKIYNPTEQYISAESIRVNHYLYFVVKNTTDIYEFDIEKEKLTILHTKIKDRGLSTIFTDGNKFYLTGFKNCIYCWNKDTDRIDVISLENKMNWIIENDENKSARFGKIVSIKDYLLFIPQNSIHFISNELILFDRISNQVKIIDLSYNSEDREVEELFIYCFKTEDEIVLQDYKRKEFIIINVNNGDISYKECDVTKRYNEKLWKSIQNVGGIYTEDNFLNIKDFMNYIVEQPDNI